jgi:lipopolysaccharide transport system permease protein
MNETKDILDDWDLVISPKKSIFDFKLKEIWKYRDLLFLFVRRDIVSFYKQTILGPLWYFIQPIFTTLVFTFVFGNLAELSTDKIPKPLFYLVGITSWNYFSDCFIKTSTVFKDNASIFGKVYFPRVITPLSIVFSNLLRFGIQMLIFLFLFLYYTYNGYTFLISYSILLFPVFILFMGMQGLGLGMIITAMTTKYRDLSYLITFGVQLMMYSTTIIYPLSSIKDKTFYNIVSLNPITFIIEGIKNGLLGTGYLNYFSFFYSFFISTLILLLGFIIFNKVEKNFVDTI